MATLTPPFDKEQELFIHTSQSSASGSPASPSQKQSSEVSSHPPLVFPASYHLTNQGTLPLDETSNQSVQAFIEHDVNVLRLNTIHKHLWCAGLERPARPFHDQIALGRDIVVTEQADLHLLWEGTRIYIKPLPDYILCYEIWKEHICHSQSLFENASGFLLSYIWLIGRESDMRIALEHGLISNAITWHKWRDFVSAVVKQLDLKSLANINIRYRRGELRLDRINWAYRLCTRTRTPTNTFRGYLYGYHDYGSFVTRNLAWLASATIYMVLVLTAMQVGLGTDRLKSNAAFQAASSGFTVFSILAPLVILVALSVVVIVLVAFNWRYTSRSRKTWSSTAIDTSAH